MNRDEIIRMAREAGGFDIMSHGWTSWVGTQSTEFLERFAALVAAHEREQCALVCEMTYEGAFEGTRLCFDTAQECAAAIRARVNT